MTLDDWLQRLAPGPLPVFSHTRQRLVEQRRRADTLAARDVAQTVLADPLATFALIQVSNQRGLRLGSETTTAEGALMLQGLVRYLDQSPGLPIVEESQFARDNRRMAALLQLTRRVYHAAWQARDFAVLHSDVRAEEVQVAALFHALPEYLLLLRAPAEAQRLARLKKRLPAAEAEQQALGVTLEQLRLPLLERWFAAELTRDLFDPRLAGRTRQTILRASLGLAEHMQKGWWDETLLEDYVALASIENLPLEEVAAIAHANAARAERAADWIACPGAGVWMAMIPGPWPEEPDDEEEKPAVAKSSAAPAQEPLRREAQPERPAPAAASVPAAAEEAEQHAVCPMPDKQVLRDVLNNIEQHLDGTLSLNQMCAVILKGLHTGLGLTRVLFALATPDGKQMKSRFTHGIPVEDPLRHFAFDLEARDLFGQLMGKMQGVWVNESNKEKFWPLVHPTLRTAIGTGDFYAMSLHVNGKPFGLIYADRGHGECGLDPHTYTDFKLLCLQSARGLAKLK